MERRKAIKNLVLSMGGLWYMPAWDYASLPLKSLNTFKNENLLAAIVDTIIPKTDTLGAKDLGVHQFIQVMLRDCHTQNEQADFDKNLSEIDAKCLKIYGKPFADCHKNQREELLKSLEVDKPDFYKTLRDLTIQGYTSSKYYLTKFTNYEMAPGHFYGCVKSKI